MNKYDVIVIGSGGAGLSAAIEATNNGKKVLIVTKTYPTHSQTVQAQGGINAVIYEDIDSIQNHVNDTYNSSKKIASIKNITTLCSKGRETIEWLNNIGVPFSKTANGKYAQRPFGGTKYTRTCYSSDYTGLKILHTLYDQCNKLEIEFLNEHVLLDLIVKNKINYGVTVLNLHNSEIIDIFSDNVILATGGYGNCYYGYTTNSISTTGDGLAIALKNSIELTNMEFVQFHPTALKGSNTLISESARAEGGYLVNSKNERFINELSTRDEVARAIKYKMLEGDDIYLDLTHIPIEILKEKMPQEVKLIKELLDLNLETDLIPINPAAHYTMGGIKSDVSCETSVKGLLVCGEISNSKIHGANRLGGNSLLEIITLGKIAGVNCTNKNENIFIVNEKMLNKIKQIFEKENCENIYSLKKELGQIMFKYVGLFRDEKGLKEAENRIYNLEKRLKNSGIKDKNKTYNKNLLEYLEVENLITISKTVILSAIERKESRGAHYRVDFKAEDKMYEKESIIRLVDDKLIVSFGDLDD